VPTISAEALGIGAEKADMSSGNRYGGNLMRGYESGKFFIKTLLVTIALTATNQSLFLLEANADKLDQTALFRARSGDFSIGTMRSITLPSPSGWRRVAAINKDPLSLAQWTPNSPLCSTGAASRLSLYSVDVGKVGPHKLLHKWFPEALRFHVGHAERGFVIVRAEAEPNQNQAVIAYPLSDQHITPLAGAVDGVNILLIAESTTQTPEELEAVVRKTIQTQIPVRTEDAKAMDVPFVLFNDKWHKTVSDRLDLAIKAGQPNAMVSKAFSMFNEADGFIPTGQVLLLKAAERGHALAQLDLIRLSRRRLLTIDVPEEKLNEWSVKLVKLGSDDARFWSTEMKKFSETETQYAGLEDLKKLSACGQPEARRTYAKLLVQSFKASERFAGRNIVMNLMRNPPLEGTLPITTRIPRAVDAPAIEKLKAAALLKTACPNEEDPEQDLFAQKSDFEIQKKSKKGKVTAAPIAEAEDFPELQEARVLDKMVNSGSMKTLKEAQKLACKWSGGEQDRNSLVIEIAARQNDAFGKWRRFRSCEVLTEHNIATVCREQELKRVKLNAEMRYRDILVTADAELRNSIAGLRKKAAEFQDALLESSYAVAKSVKQKTELDRTRRAMDNEFLDLVGATMTQDLQNQINDVVTGRRLMLLPPNDEEAKFALRRQPPSALFLNKELKRLEARMGETVKSIEDADQEDLSKDFKNGFSQAYEAWKAYRKSYAAFSAKLAEQGKSNASALAAADLWFHIEGIYYFELLRDRELNRPDVPPETERVPASYEQSYEE
jgi:hypothetical protein